MRWIALDTETYQGSAFLLATPSGCHVLDPRYGGPSATVLENYIEVLRRLPKKSVYYNLDYDIAALVKCLGSETVRRIYLSERVEVLRDVTMDYLPGRHMRVTIAGERWDHYDLYPFFQRSLSAAATAFLPVSARKGSLDGGMIARLSPTVFRRHKREVLEYALQDARTTQALLDLVLESAETAGLKTKSLYSPGNLAKQYLRSQGIRPMPEPGHARELARAAYYGGRIETFQRGTFSDVELWDISSAYPHAAASLPYFGDAHVEPVRAGLPASEYFIARGRLSTSVDAIPLLPIRRDGVLRYPHLNGMRVTLTSLEYRALPRGSVFEPECGIAIYPQGSIREMIERLYRERQESPAKSLINKLILNSMYGIFAERKRQYLKIAPWQAYYRAVDNLRRGEKGVAIAALESLCPEVRRYWARVCECNACAVARRLARGRRFLSEYDLLESGDDFYRVVESRGKYMNMIQASFITAFVRVRVQRALELCGSDAISCATDSVTVIADSVGSTLMRAHALAGDRGLGSWNLEARGPMLAIGAGVYEHAGKSRLRGFRYSGSLKELLESRQSSAVYHIAQRKRLSGPQLVRLPLHHIGMFNVLADAPKKLDLNFDSKRVWPSRVDGTALLSGVQESVPPTEGG